LLHYICPRALFLATNVPIIDDVLNARKDGYIGEYNINEYVIVIHNKTARKSFQQMHSMHAMHSLITRDKQARDKKHLIKLINKFALELIALSSEQLEELEASLKQPM